MMGAEVATRTKVERVEGVIQNLLDGKTLRKAIDGYFTDAKVFFDAIAGERELSLRYARALEFRGDLLVDEALEISDGDGDPAKVRNQVAIRQWLATKQASKRYGERIDLNVQQSISINDARAEALQRTRILRPVSDQQEIEDARSPSVVLPLSLDSQSNSAPAAPPVPPEADIFS